MSRSAPQAIATIDQFLQTVGPVKTAADGSTPMSEPGSIGGDTTHPVKKVDDRLQKVPEGERFKENTTDVKEDQGKPSVENAAEASTKKASSIFGTMGQFAKKAEGAVSTPGSAADDHLAVNTKVAPTGEDPAHETNSAKAGKEDKKQGNMGGTKHPASTENDQLDGHKYASDTPLEKLAGDMKNLGNNLLAALHNCYQGNGVQAPQTTKTAAAAAPQVDSRLAFQAGHELAGLLNGTFDKRAADQMVHEALTGVIKQASDDADMFINYATNFVKAAAGEEQPPGGPMPAGGGGGDMPPPGGAPGGEAGGDASGMLSALGGGAGAEGGAGGGDMGGGGGGMEGIDPEALQLAKLLEQAGITPEEIQAAMEQESGGGGAAGGMPPSGDAAGGGAPPPPGGGGMETQANAGGRKTNVQASSVKQAEMVNYIKELVSRTRLRK